MDMQINMINVESIVPNRFQPRKNFNQIELQELADSIKQHGMIQPMVLRRLGNKYEIIAGERRYKAAIMNGMINVPAIVMNLDDATSAEVALIENVQRRDLTPIEEAQSYHQILQLGQMTQNEMAQKMGRNQSTIANKLRLLNLSNEVQQALLENKISERHARSLLSLKNHELENKLLALILEKRLTVRETDLEVKKIIETSKNEEILDFDEEPKTKEEVEEIIDFGEEPSKEEESIIAQNIPAQDSLTKEETKENLEQPQRKRSKFFNIEEDQNMNENTDLVQAPQNLTTESSQIMSNINSNINYVAQQDYNHNYQQPYIPQQPNYGSQPQGIQPNYPPQQDYNQNFQQPYGPQQPNYGSQPQVIQPNYPPQQDYNQNYQQPYVPQQPNYEIQPQGIQQNYASQPYIPQQNTSFSNSSQNQYNLPNVENSTPETPLPQFGDANMGVQEEASSQQSIMAQQDITGAVSVIRNTIMNLQNNGYMLDAEEFDFENIHQITIKIKK